MLSMLVTACGHESAPRYDDGGNGDGGNANGDGGAIDRSSHPKLRASVALDFASVVSFASVSGGGGSGAAVSPIRKGIDGGADASGDAGPGSPAGGLYALTLAGDALSVSLVEEGNPNANGALREPSIDAIFPTPTWILFRAGGYEVSLPGDDGGVNTIPCSTIAARRSDGALFCSGFAGSPSTLGFDFSLQSNAAGDVVYLEAGSPAGGDSRVHRVSLGGAGGPTATPITPPIAAPGWFYSNADGDLLHEYTPSPLDPSVIALAIFPVDGSAAIPFGSRPAGQATRGAFGSPDENTFYVLVGGGAGIGFAGSIRVLTKQAGGFVETEVTPNLPMVSNYGILLRLGSDIYLFSASDKALAKVFSEGVLVANPAPVAIQGVTSFLNVQGVMATPTGAFVTFLANTPTGTQFIRHDGTTQQDIPVPNDITLTRVIFAQSGAIDVIGVRTSTLETVRGSIEPASTSLTIATTGVLDPNRIVTFTRIQ